MLCQGHHQVVDQPDGNHVVRQIPPQVPVIPAVQTLPDEPFGPV